MSWNTPTIYSLAEAFYCGFQRGNHGSLERIRYFYQGDNNMITVWKTREGIIALVLIRTNQKWLVLREVPGYSRGMFIRRANAILRRFKLGSIRPHDKKYYYFPPDTGSHDQPSQPSQPWTGRKFFCIISAKEPLPHLASPAVAERLARINL